ncbi:MAG TPA: hypothetical protein VNZ22_23060, partial [Bacillota bacterium]|nr:hypothetical protein [Bacillota bacterium]
GQSYWRTNRVRVPVVESGSYYLLFKTDADNSLFESDESHNVVVVPISLQVQRPDLALLDVQTPSLITGPPYPSVTLVWAVTNQGPGAALGPSWPWTDTLKVSLPPTLEWEGWEVASWSETNTVPAGGSYWRTNTVRLPLTTSGTYYLVLAADEQNQLDEPDYRNNTRAVPVTFEVRPPDLAPVAFLAPTEIAGPLNSTLTLVWGVTNLGSGPAAGELSWWDQVFLSTKAELDGTELSIGEWQETDSVPAGGSYWRTNTVQLPETASGSFYLLFQTEARHDLAESAYSNNVAVVPVSIQVPAPDLAPVLWQMPTVVTGPPMPTITVVIGVTNRGGGPVPGNNLRWDGAYVSTSPFPGWADSYFGFWPWSNTVAAGGSYWITNTLQVPVTESGTYYLFFTTDIGKHVVDSDEENNVAVAKVTFELSPPPDLAPVALQVPALVNGPTNPTITLAWHVANQGFGPVWGPWSDSVSLSTGAHLSAAQWPIVSVCQTNTLAAGADYWQTNTVVLPVTQSGTYHLTLTANASSNVFECAWENNALTVPVRFELSLPHPVAIGGGQVLSDGSFQVAVSGVVGSNYILQASTDLVNWSDVVNFTCVETPTYVVDPSAKDLGQRFYRVAVPTNQN